MSCCNNTNCETCGEQSAFSSPLGEVSKGISMLVSDRNGNPKALAAKSFALASSSDGGEHKMRTGAVDDPINIKLIQELLNGNAVLVRNGQGVLGVVLPDEDDTFLAYVGKTLQFVKTVPKSNLFNSQEVTALAGRVAVLGCTTNGTTELGFLSADGDYVSLEDGKIVGKFYDDISEATELDYLIGVVDGEMKKIAPSEDKILVEEDGKWVVKDAGVGVDTWVGSAIYTKNYASVSDLNFSNNAIPFGPGVPNTAKMVQLRLIHLADLQQYYCTTRISINNTEILIGQNSGSFQSHHDSAVLYVPYGDGTFAISASTIPYSNASGTYAGGAFSATVLSYK